MPLRHPGKILALAFSPDGKLLATGATDKNARLWETATGRPLGPVMMHAQQVNAVAFSRDGLLATGSWDRTARLWRIPAPLAGSVSAIKLQLRVDTGLELDEHGAVVGMPQEAWEGCFHLLHPPVKNE
jgi:WD40 repeat protein